MSGNKYGLLFSVALQGPFRRKLFRIKPHDIGIR
jgi:hypothetical protein